MINAVGNIFCIVIKMIYAAEISVCRFPAEKVVKILVEINCMNINRLSRNTDK